jgi:hypothetical protein
VALAGVVSVGLMLTARADLRPLTRAAATNTPYSHGLSPFEGLSEFGDFRWAATDAVAVIPVSDRWLQLTLWAPYANVAERDILARVSVNGREVIAHRFTTADANTYFVAMPSGARWVTIEYAVSGNVFRQRAIQIAVAWRPAPPPHAPVERVVP